MSPAAAGDLAAGAAQLAAAVAPPISTTSQSRNTDSTHSA